MPPLLVHERTFDVKAHLGCGNPADTWPAGLPCAAPRPRCLHHESSAGVALVAATPVLTSVTVVPCPVQCVVNDSGNAVRNDPGASNVTGIMTR